MKKLISIMFIGSALTFAACGKDKKPAAADPAAPAAAADPAKPADPAAPAPATGEAKPEDKKPAGGW